MFLACFNALLYLDNDRLLILLVLCWSAAACRDFQENSAEQESERQARLSRFSGAAAISSDAYFNRWAGLQLLLWLVWVINRLMKSHAA